MLEVCYNPFMAYFICHESWLYLNSMMPLMGFIMCMAFKCQIVILGFMNYRLGNRNRHSSGQGGGVNAPRELGVSISKIGLSWKSGSFGISLCEHVSSLWSVSWREVWFSVPLWKVFPSFWFCSTCLLVLLVQRFGILLIFSLSSICR